MTTPILNEGIKSIEDLDVKSFIDVVRRIGTLDATEKLDGTSLWFGIDGTGRLFTARPNSKEHMYSEADYPYFAANNGIRGAHAALQAKEEEIRETLSVNDTIEISVMYGRQPNSVTYGLDDKSFIAIVQAVNGTDPSKKDALAKLLENQDVTVKTSIVETTDGDNLDRHLLSQTFRFVTLQKINSTSLGGMSFEKELKKLESFLSKDSDVETLSNMELMTVSLGSIPQESRAHAKAAKEQLLATVKNEYMGLIKSELLKKYVSKLKPILGAADADEDEDVGVGGVVFSDPTTGEQFKIEDRTNFETINQFNYAVRNQISGAVKTVDDSASLEARGGITGLMKIRIADLLGNAELAITRSANQIFSDNMGSSVPDTLKKVAKTLNGGDDFNGAKRKIAAIVSATLDELTAMLADFKKYKDDPENSYRLKLRGGKSIGLSKEVVKRTLLSFAEAKRNLRELHENVVGAQSFTQLVAILYGRAAKDAHASENLEVELEEEVQSYRSSELLLETRNFTSKERYAEVKTSWDLFNIYLATIIMATIIYKADDKRGIRFLKDKPHYRMTKWSPVMSPVNFWGYVIWHAEKPSVAKLLKGKIASEINHVTKKVSWAWSKMLHMDLSFAQDVPIDWDDHYKTMKFLIQHAPMMNTHRVNTMLTGAFTYDELTHDEKVKLLPKVYFYAQQFVPTSPIIFRIRAILNKELAGDEMKMSLLTSFENAGPLVAEDEMAAGEPEGSPVAPLPSKATNSASVSTVDMGIGRYKNIVKRKRNPDVKGKKFERPKKETT